MQKAIARNLQAATVVLILGLWLRIHAVPYGFFITMTVLMVLLSIYEYLTGSNQAITRLESLKEVGFLIGTFFVIGPRIYFWLDQVLVPLRNWIHASFWPYQWPLLGRTVLAFLIMDFSTYWLHRLEHHLKWGFKFHGLHHSSTHFNWRRALINHPVDIMIMSFCVLIPSVIGAQESELMGAGLLGYCTTFFSHANIAPQDRWLNHIFVTHEYHARHHSVDLKESLSNFACSFSIWDRLFGTFQGYGFSGKLGLSSEEKYRGYLDQVFFLLQVRQASESRVLPNLKQ